MHASSGEIPRARLVVHRQRRDGGAGGDAWQVLGLSGGVAAGHERVRGERDGGEVGRAQKSGSHLFKHDVQLDRSVPLSPELFGDTETLQRQLVGHLLPHRGVVAFGGGHEPANFALG